MYPILLITSSYYLVSYALAQTCFHIFSYKLFQVWFSHFGVLPDMSEITVLFTNASSWALSVGRKTKKKISKHINPARWTSKDFSRATVVWAPVISA